MSSSINTIGSLSIELIYNQREVLKVGKEKT